MAAVNWETIKDLWSSKVVTVEIFRGLWNFETPLWLTTSYISYYNWHIESIFSVRFSARCLKEKKTPRYSVHTPGCVISRCQIYDHSSLFVRLRPGAHERGRLAFLGPFPPSVKGFSLLLCRQPWLNCIASEAFLTLMQGHRKYSLSGGSWEETRSKKGGRKLTLQCPTCCCFSWNTCTCFLSLTSPIQYLP